MEEEKEESDPFKTGIKFFAIGIVTVCFIGGIILNILFIRRNDGFTKGKEKLWEVKLFFSLLAIFNILYLIDAILFVVYLMNSGIPNNAMNSLCVFYNHYSQFIMLGIFYCIVTCSKNCFVISLNNPKYKYSNGCQMIIEAFTFWSLFIMFFLFELFSIFGYKTFFTIPADIASFLMSVISLLFVALTYCKAKNLNLQESQSMHITWQTRNICIMYFVLWFPSIFMNIYSGYLMFYKSSNGQKVDRFVRDEYFFRVLSYVLEYVAVASFPLFCKSREDVVVEHELL
ncbi:UNVERIFIED_CONTAM: hypothetical protein RMT77_005644 [Armadillidium vulgare]